LASLATTRKKSKKVLDPELKYRPIEWSKGQFPGCCGIGAPHLFSEPEGAYDYTGWNPIYRQVDPKFKTREEQAKDCLKRMYEWAKEQNYYCIQIALVKEYNPNDYDDVAPQFPDLVEAMKADGWRCDREWLAPRHKNKLWLWSIVLDGMENEKVPEKGEDDDEDEDDYDDDDF
jgi:hypothetical protein